MVLAEYFLDRPHIHAYIEVYSYVKSLISNTAQNSKIYKIKTLQRSLYKNGCVIFFFYKNIATQKHI